MGDPLTLHVRWARGNQLGADGWTAVADALEGVTSLTSLNGCDKCRAIQAGGQTELRLDPAWELGVWAARYLPRSASTLTRLDLRQASQTVHSLRALPYMSHLISEMNRIPRAHKHTGKLTQQHSANRHNQIVCTPPYYISCVQLQQPRLGRRHRHRGTAGTPDLPAGGGSQVPKHPLACPCCAIPRLRCDVAWCIGSDRCDRSWMLPVFIPLLPRPIRSPCVCARWTRGNQLGADEWTAVADALEGVTSLTSLNGCDTCRAIQAGGQSELLLETTELGVWAARYLPRSASTLTRLDLRQARIAAR